MYIKKNKSEPELICKKYLLHSIQTIKDLDPFISNTFTRTICFLQCYFLTHSQAIIIIVQFFRHGYFNQTCTKTCLVRGESIIKLSRIPALVRFI